MAHSVSVDEVEHDGDYMAAAFCSDCTDKSRWYHADREDSRDPRGAAYDRACKWANDHEERAGMSV